MRILVYLFFLTVAIACSERKKPAQPTEPKPDAQTDSGRAQVRESGAPPSTLNRNPEADTWHYAKTVDKEGRTVHKASLVSPTLLEFDFPYNGGSTATLTIRQRNDDTHVYIQVSKGQFNRSFQEGRARVHFDNGTPVTYTFSAAENGSANVIFFNNERALIKKIKAARRMVVDVEFEGQGKRQIEFRTSGLTWNY